MSGVDEDAVAAGLGAQATVEAVVSALAEAKASAVVDTIGDNRPGRAVVVACDSLLDLDGAPLGKPSSAAEARSRWLDLRGRTAILRTGHTVVDLPGGRRASGVGSTTVRFGRPTDAELDAYLATGEALGVAGGFTLDGRSAPFIDGVDGDPGTVIGLSLPLLRHLLHQLDISVTDLWC